mgnify:CR=1 FL=1
MEVKYSLYVNGYEDKERIVEALTNNGYIVGAELEKDHIFDVKGWRIDIYNEPNKDKSKWKGRMEMSIKGFFEDWDGEEVLSDARNFKDEKDFLEQATKYVEETRGYHVPLINVVKTTIIFNDEEWRYKNDMDLWNEVEEEKFIGEELVVYKAELDYGSVED